MSNSTNTILEENAWEAFHERYETDLKFKDLIISKFNEVDWWKIREFCPIKAEFDALERIFEAEYSPLR